MMPKWTDALKEWRDDEGHTNAEAASVLGISDHTWGSIIYGRSDAVSRGVAAKINAITGYPLDQIPVCRRGIIATEASRRRKNHPVIHRDEIDHTHVEIVVGDIRYDGNSQAIDEATAAIVRSDLGNPWYQPAQAGKDQGYSECRIAWWNKRQGLRVKVVWYDNRNDPDCVRKGRIETGPKGILWVPESEEKRNKGNQ